MNRFTTLGAPRLQILQQFDYLEHEIDLHSGDRAYPDHLRWLLVTGFGLIFCKGGSSKLLER